jgi:hypothetical protein
MEPTERSTWTKIAFQVRLATSPGRLRRTSDGLQETPVANSRGNSMRPQAQPKDLYGQTADAARQTAVTFDKWLRDTIETQPYTSALVAVGIGWLLGRMHRPF